MSIVQSSEVFSAHTFSRSTATQWYSLGQDPLLYRTPAVRNGLIPPDVRECEPTRKTHIFTRNQVPTNLNNGLCRKLWLSRLGLQQLVTSPTDHDQWNPYPKQCPPYRGIALDPVRPSSLLEISLSSQRPGTVAETRRLKVGRAGIVLLVTRV